MFVDGDVGWVPVMSELGMKTVITSLNMHAPVNFVSTGATPMMPVASALWRHTTSRESVVPYLRTNLISSLQAGPVLGLRTLSHQPLGRTPSRWRRRGAFQTPASTSSTEHQSHSGAMTLCPILVLLAMCGRDLLCASSSPGCRVSGAPHWCYPHPVLHTIKLKTGGDISSTFMQRITLSTMEDT